VDELRNHFSLPVLLGVSRKSFLGNITGQDVTAREWATASAVAVGCFSGADILRVHDVAHQQQVIAVAAALRDAKNLAENRRTYCGNAGFGQVSS
jgi:dihydropteroate synthase